MNTNTQVIDDFFEALVNEFCMFDSPAFIDSDQEDLLRDFKDRYTGEGGVLHERPD